MTARRDAYVAGFALLAAMGRAEAKDLNLVGRVLYDPVPHAATVRGRLFDFDTAPALEPVATGTSQVPAQDFTVTPPAAPR